MRFPSIRKQQSYTVKVPQLNGGVNYAVPPHLIMDNQLSDVKNMWVKDGLLQTRPGLKYADSALSDTNEVVPDKVVSFGDMAMAYGFNPNSEAPEMCFVLVNANGTFRAEDISTYSWKGLEGTGITPVAILPAQVNADAGEEVARYDVVIYVSFSDGSVEAYGIVDQTMTKLEPYLPIILMSGTAQNGMNVSEANGTMLEPYNMLTDGWRCYFTATGDGADFILPEKNLDQNATYTMRITGPNGVTHEATFTSDNHNKSVEDKVVWSGHLTNTTSDEEVYSTTGNHQYASKISGAVLDLTNGKFGFIGSVEISETDLENGIFGIFPVSSSVANNVEFIKNPTGYSKAGNLGGMTFGTWFGGGSASLTNGTRLFVSGNAKHPNLVRWSSLNNPLYFPENNYAYVGGSSSRVTAFGKQSELLVIFKDSEIYCTQYTTGETVTAEELMEQSVIDQEAAIAVFPMVQLHPAIGCDCPDTIQLCNNRLVWLNSTGTVYGLFTTGQYNERNVRKLSNVIEHKLRYHEMAKLKAANAAEYENHYLLNVDGTIYVMDYSSSGFTYYSSYSNDEKAQKATPWYVWDLRNTGYFYENAKPHLLTVGQTALLLGEDRYGYPVLLSFTGKGSDAFLDKENETLTSTVSIRSGFKTKLFEFERPDVKKKVGQLYLGLADMAGSTVRVSYETEQWTEEDAYVIECAGDNEGNENGCIKEWRLTPNVSRVRTFGIRCESEGCMAVQGILIKYQHQGVVR